MKYKNNIEKKIWEAGGPMEAIYKLDGELIGDIIKEELRAIDFDYYLSASNNLCARTFATIEYYNSLCNKLGIKSNWIESGLSIEAKTPRYSIEWVEHDLIIAFKPILKERVFDQVRYYSIYNLSETIPSEYILWNVKPINFNNKYYALAIKKSEIIEYRINIKNVRAYEITEFEYNKFIEHHRASDPEELKEHLFGFDEYYKKHGLLFKPVIERLFGVKINKRGGVKNEYNN